MPVMNDPEMERKAIEVVNKAYADQQPTNVYVRAKVGNFLEGALFFIRYRSSRDTKEYQPYVYFKGDNPLLINNSEELATLMSGYQPEHGLYKFCKDVFSLGAIAGIIALLITITICFLVAYRGIEKPPEILSAALTTILGFYFGSKVSK